VVSWGVVAMRVCDVIDLPVAAMTAASSAAMARGLPLGRPKELPNRKEADDRLRKPYN
jgi:hypothetical protein